MNLNGGNLHIVDLKMWYGSPTFVMDQNYRTMATIDSALDEFMQLDFNSREMLLDIMQKRQIEARRKQIARNAKSGLRDYQAGKLKRETASAMIRRLEQL